VVAALVLNKNHISDETRPDFRLTTIGAAREPIRAMNHAIGLPEVLLLLVAVVTLWAIFRPRGPFGNGRL
jgi:hypothetical protein